jgi:fructosamine-3-kinase
MSRQAAGAPWLGRLSRVAGAPARVARLTATVSLVETTTGRSLVAKQGPGAQDEAEGLHRLGAVPGAPPVPEVVLVDDDLLVTAAVPRGPRTDAHDDSLGRSLAMLHDAVQPHWGGGSSWIGACRIDPSPRADAATFYGARLAELASRCGLEPAVSDVVTRLGELLPPGGPALLHGDLWWGNVLDGADGRSWLIDPSVHAGHPEEDLAMLALFGRLPQRFLDAYREVRTLPDGWRNRTELFQLYPLLVHAILFGGGYRVQAERVARRFA